MCIDIPPVAQEVILGDRCHADYDQHIQDVFIVTKIIIPIVHYIMYYFSFVSLVFPESGTLAL